jgi:ABC-type transport system substrate-binding protein
MALAATLAGLALVPAGATRTSIDGGTFREGGTFRVGVPGGFVESIDPTAVGVALGFLRTTCAGLLTTPDKPLPSGFRVVPEIAADYPKVSRNGKTYTFTLRNDFRFSTGARVTARDFAHTINRILNPVMRAAAALDLNAISGAQDVIDGKVQTAKGVIAKGDTLTIRLTKPVGDFASRLAFDLCVVPANLPIDPEGATAPIPAAGPYYVSKYVPGQVVDVERNRYYRGDRPHHVHRFSVDLTVDLSAALDRVERGELDYAWVPNNEIGARANDLKRKYGVNKERFFVEPGTFLRMFVLNTEGPLFRNNPRLRQAVNFAVDRKALQRERGGTLAGTLTDQFLPPGLPAYRNVTIYPLRAPDLRKARMLAQGHTRTGKAVLYAATPPLATAQAQIVQRNLKAIGLDVEIKQFPAPLYFQKLATRGEPFDIGSIGFSFPPDPGYVLTSLFDGRTIGKPGFTNWSYFDSAKVNHLLARAARLRTGPSRNRTYRDLDVQLARDAAPAVPFSYDNSLTLVGPRTGCVVVNPDLDLTAVCLK